MPRLFDNLVCIVGKLGLENSADVIPDTHGAAHTRFILWLKIAWNKLFIFFNAEDSIHNHICTVLDADERTFVPDNGLRLHCCCWCLYAWRVDVTGQGGNRCP